MVIVKCSKNLNWLIYSFYFFHPSGSEVNSSTLDCTVVEKPIVSKSDVRQILGKKLQILRLRKKLS